MAAKALGEIIHCLGCGKLSATGKRWEGTCNGDAIHGPTESVTAYDARDVDPLLLAARAINRERVQAGTSKRLPDNDTTRELLENLAAALAPFDSEEEK